MHLNSTDGHGEFNWRMKFPMKVPVAFPRLQIMVVDQKSLSADTSLGYVTIKFDNICKKLLQDHKYECEPRAIPLKMNENYNRVRLIIFKLKIIGHCVGFFKNHICARGQLKSCWRRSRRAK